MLKRLRLKNWTSHKNSELQFGKGANVLLGVMGSGKSSVLEAISFALFGSIPEGSRRKAKLSDLIRFGEESSEVELGFDISGTDYRVVRKINRKESSEAYLYRGSALVSQTPAMVNKHIEKLLGLDYSLFSEIVYSAQNRIDSFINLPPKGRKTMIDEIIGLNGLLKVEENSTKLLNRLRMVSKEISVLMPSEKELNGKKAELERVKESIREKEREKKGVESQLERMEKGLAEAKEAHGRISRKRREHLLLSERLSSLKGRLGALKSSHRKDLDEDAEKKINSELSGLEKARESLETKERRLEKEMGTLKSEITRASLVKERRAKALEDLNRIREILSKANTAKEVSAKLSEMEKGIEGSKERIGMAKAGIEAALKGMEGMEGAGTKCPVCMSPLEEHRKQDIEKHWKETELRLRKDIAEEETKLKKSSEERLRLSEILKKIEFYHAKMETFEAQIAEMKETDAEKAKASLAEMEKEGKEAKKDIMEMVGRLSDLENELKDIRRNIAIGKEILESEREVAEIERKSKELEYSEEEYARAESEYRRIGNELERQKGILEKADSEIRISSAMEKELGSFMEKLDSYRERRERVESAIQEISVFRETLNQMQLVLRNNIVEDINVGINGVWAYAYPYNDYGKIRIIGDMESYNFEVFANGEWKDISTIASGGEKTMFAIALRITLAMVLAPQLSWVILDEPTHNLDENGIEKLNSLMAERLPEIIDQFIIVTHDGKMASLENGNIFNFHREKSGNDATSLEKIR